MLDIKRVDHVGIRVSDKSRAIAFYQQLGFELIDDVGFDRGHPVILQHPSGDVLNLLGPATARDSNILMDVDAKHPGITHVSYRIASIEAAKTILGEQGIPLSGEFEFKGMHAIFIRDPDLNVIELDAYEGDEPATRTGEGGPGYDDHP